MNSVTSPSEKAMAKKGAKQNRRTATRKRREQQILKVRNFVGPFPPLVVRTVRYVEQFAMIETSAGVGFKYNYSPSSLYDPNNSGVGHQPMYFDQLCASTGPYTRYRALSTRMRITYVTTSSEPTTVGAFITLDSSSVTSLSMALEKPMVKWSNLAQSSGSNNKWICEWNLDHAKCMNVLKSQLLNDDYFAGDYSSSPTRNFFVQLFLYGNSSVASGYVTVELDTTAQFFGLTKTGQS